MRDELDLYIRARYPLLWVVTAEEQRALREIDELGKAQRKRVQLWSTTRGLVNAALPDREDTSKRDPLQLLKSILDDSEAGIWVLRDFHPFLKDAGVVRRLREIAFSQSDQKANKTVILLGPVLKLPPELEKENAVVDFDLPTSEQLQSRLDDMTARLQESSRIEVRLDRRQRGERIAARAGGSQLDQR